jgi:hypothetical protein
VTTADKDRIVDEIAKILATYMYQATLGESRHVRYQVKASVQRHSRVMSLIKLGISVPYRETNEDGDYDDDEVIGRGTYIEHLPAPKDRLHMLKISNSCFKLFAHLKWPTGYGGKLWSDINALLSKYLTGELPPTLFVDAAFNIRHNGGMAFDKTSWLSCYNRVLASQLAVKQQFDVEQLLRLTEEHYPHTRDFVFQRSILTVQESADVAA